MFKTEWQTLIGHVAQTNSFEKPILRNFVRTVAVLIIFPFLPTMVDGFVIPIIANAIEQTSPKTMSGYAFKDFEGFKNWNVVTVRYRRDTKEMRWTFANDIAWKTIEQGRIDYPTGAIFAKIGVMTQEDSQFPSSAIPAGITRYQFMVRDKNKHKETGGWGYAIFGDSGHIIEEDPIKTSKACFACHKIVENRGQIFSQPVKLGFNLNTKFMDNSKMHIEFFWKKNAQLPQAMKKYISSQVAEIRVINGSHFSPIFQGTLDEIRPLLENEARTAGSPTALIEGKQFSMVSPIELQGCKKGNAFKSVSTLTPPPGGEPDVQSREYCNE